MALDSIRSQVAHLLRRAGFGFTEAELTQYTALGFAGAVDRLLNPEQVDDSATDQLVAPLALDPNDAQSRRKIEAAKFWWLNRMLRTQRPLWRRSRLPAHPLRDRQQQSCQRAVDDPPDRTVPRQRPG
jgi:hypothetical protein